MNNPAKFFSSFNWKSKFPRKKVLVLEGGGMRGIFLVGVLQAFAERNYNPWRLVIGSSAGALTAMPYLSGQIYLARDAFFTTLLSKNFIQYSNMFKPDQHILDLDWMINTILIDGREKLNIKKLKRSCPLLITATQIEEDLPPQTVYFSSKKDDLLIALKATAAIPYLYKGFVKYQNKLFLDGGLMEPVPYQKALLMGYREKEILVLTTRPRGYRKKKMAFWIRAIYENYYKEPQYAPLLDTLLSRFKSYNKSLDDLEKTYRKIDVIYPPDDFEVKRLTREEKKILTGFEQGISQAVNFLHPR